MVAHDQAGLEAVQVGAGLELAIQDGVELDNRYHTSLLSSQSKHSHEQDAPDHKPAPKQDGRILGLRRGHFWIIVAIATLAVIVAAVGGGVAAAITNKAKSSKSESNGSSSAPLPSSRSIAPSIASTDSTTLSAAVTSTSTGTTTTASTSTSRITSSAASAFPTTGILALDCPAIDNETYNSKVSGRSYTFRYHCQSDGAGEDSVQRRKALSIDSCADLCSAWNTDQKSQDCKGVTWNGNLTSTIINQEGNCFLKLGNFDVVYCGDICSVAVTAVMINSIS